MKNNNWYRSLDKIDIINWEAKVERERHAFLNEVLVPVGLFLVAVLVFWIEWKYR